MALLPISTNITDKILKPLDPLLNFRTSGSQLKFELGLGKFPYVMLQKVIDVPMNVFVITVDSRRPTLYLSPFRVRSADSTRLMRVKQYGLAYLAKDFKMTPPMPIERTSPLVGLSSIYIVRDLAGNYIMDHKLYESKESKYIILDYNKD